MTTQPRNIQKALLLAQLPAVQLPLGGNLDSRTATDPKEFFPRGATANNFIASTSSVVTTKDMHVVDSFITGREPNSQSIIIPTLPPLNTSVEISLLPETARIVTGYGAAASGSDEFTATSPNFVNKYSDMIDVNSISLFGFNVGDQNLSLGTSTTLGDFVANDVGDDISTDWTNARFVLKTGSNGAHGTTKTSRSLSEIGNDSTTANATTGWGVSPGTGKTAAKQSVDILKLIRLRSTVTISPPLNSTDAPMKFTVKAGNMWFGEYSLRDKETGEYLTKESMQGFVDFSDGTFIQDWVLDTSKIDILDTLNLYTLTGPAVVIAAGTHISIPVSLSCSLAIPEGAELTPLSSDVIDFIDDVDSGKIDFFLPSGTGDGQPGTGSGTGPGTDRDLPVFGTSVVLSSGTSYSSQFTVRSFMDVGPGFKIPADSVTSAIISGANTEDKVRQRLTFGRVVMEPGFAVESDVMLLEVVSSNSPITVQAGSVTNIPQSIPATSRWGEEIPIDDAVFSAGHILQSYLKLRTPQILRSNVTLAQGSEIGAGSVLRAGATTLGGMRALENSEFPADTPIESDLDLPTMVELNELDPTAAYPNIKYQLDAGTIVRSNNDGCKTTLPVGFHISNENTAPDAIRINPNDNVTLLEDMEVNGATLGPGFTFTQGVKFSPKFEFVTGSILNNVVLPHRSVVPKDSKLPFEMPYSVGTIIPKAAKFLAGTKFIAGVILPKMLARPQEDRDSAANSVPFLTVTAEGKPWIVYPEGTVFGNGASIFKGSVMLADDMEDAIDSTSGVPVFVSTTHNGTIFITGSEKYTLEQEEYKLQHSSQGSGSVAAQGLDIDVGVALTNTIILRSEMILPKPIAIPLIDSSSVFNGITFAKDFILKRDICIDDDYEVYEEQSVFHPRNKELPFDFVLTSDFSIASSFTLFRKITLPDDASDYFENVLPEAGSFIKMPAVQTVVRNKFKIGSEELVIGNDLGDSKSYIILNKGQMIFTRENNGDDGLKLRSPVTLTSDWKILSPITKSPAFNVAGLFLKGGSRLPGSIIIGSQTPFPKGLQLATPVQLLEKFVFSDDTDETYTLLSGSYLVEESKFTKGSIIRDDCDIKDFSYGPVVSWNDDNLFLFQDQKITPQIQYNFFHGVNPFSASVDYSSRIADLEMIVGLLENRTA